MKSTRFAALAFAAALFAGCSEAKTDRRVGKKAPFPVEKAPTPPPATGEPVTPIKADTSSGHVNTPPPVQPTKPPPVVVPPPPVAKRGQSVGEAAPELVLEDTTGSAFLLTSYRGKKPVLLVFSATW